MGLSGSKNTKEKKNKERTDVLIPFSLKIPFEILGKLARAVCKIMTESNERIIDGSGFFLNYSDSKKFLMTCYHLINPTLKNNKIQLTIHNGNKMNINFDNRFTKFMAEPEDIALIEIKKSDEIYNKVEYLNYDKSFTNGGYSLYKDAEIFSLQLIDLITPVYSSGKILSIYGNEFEHDISAESGSAGRPILLLNNNINLIRVIGIHKPRFSKIKKINYGTFIGEILDKELKEELNEKLNKELNNNKNNYIIAEINIEDENINNDIRIINSYEEYLRNGKDKDKILKNTKFNNEEEIKNCEIKIR